MMRVQSTKERVDLLLVEQGRFPSRSRAQEAILAGKVRVGEDHVVRKSNEKWERNTNFSVTEASPFVSRGAYKLLPALDRYRPGLEGLTALDLGASTGGFTDLLLHRGARKIYAVDVGYGQLHYRLRNDPRVVCLEKINARYLTCKDVPEKVDILTADLSFISLKKVLPAADTFLKNDSWIFLLIKPQFEARKNELQKGGVIKSDVVHSRIINEIKEFAGGVLKWKSIDTIPAPIKGPKGNLEFMGVFRRIKSQRDNSRREYAKP